MPQLSDASSLLNLYSLAGNLNGNAVGTITVPNIILSKDSEDDYVVDYTLFRSYTDISSASYYDPNDTEPQNIVDGDEYNQNIENAIQSILTPTNFYSTSFSDVAQLSFLESTSGTGILTFAQMDFASDIFPEIEASAGSYFYKPTLLQYPSERYGDIFINTEHDLITGLALGDYNFWEESGNIEIGTRAYKVLMEEISHSLGIDIVGMDSNGDELSKNSAIDSHKYTVTSRIIHPDMAFDRTTFYAVSKDINVENASGNPFPTSLGIYDIAALQAIYGADTTTRIESGTTYTDGQGFYADVSEAFLYTIWDAGGDNDVIDTRDYLTGVEIDLREGHFSSIGDSGNGQRVAWDSVNNDRGNVGIAYGAVIENAIGTGEADSFFGNAYDNHVIGGEGNDRFDTGNPDVGIGAVTFNGDGSLTAWDAHGNDKDTLESIEIIDAESIVVDHINYDAYKNMLAAGSSFISVDVSGVLEAQSFTTNSGKFSTIYGTNSGDTYSVFASVSGSPTSAQFITGTGNDTVIVNPSSTQHTYTGIVYTDGNDTYTFNGQGGSISIGEGVSLGQMSVSSILGEHVSHIAQNNGTVIDTYSLSATVNIGGRGTITLSRNVTSIFDEDNPVYAIQLADGGQLLFTFQSNFNQSNQDLGSWEWSLVSGDAPDNVSIDLTKNNVIEGTESGNYIRGMQGDDTLDGGDGNDTIHGGQGTDSIKGGSGIDTLYGGRGDDNIFFGDSDDVYGGQGNDKLFVEEGVTRSDVYDFVLGEDVFYFHLIGGVDDITDISVSAFGVSHTELAFGANGQNIILHNVILSNDDRAEAFNVYEPTIAFSYILPLVPTTVQYVEDDPDYMNTAFAFLQANDPNGEVLQGSFGTDDLLGASGDDYLYRGDGLII